MVKDFERENPEYERGFREGIEAAARYVEQHGVVFASDGKKTTNWVERADTPTSYGAVYAEHIRALKPETTTHDG